MRELWRDAQEKYPILKNFEVDGERILQVLYLMTVIRDKQLKYIEPTRSDLMDLKIERIKEEWIKASESLAKTYEFAKAQGARPETLPRPSLLISLAAVWSLIFNDAGTDPFNNSKNHDFIRRWYFSKVMQSSRSQVSNYQISQDFQVLLKYAHNGERPEFPQVTLNVDIEDSQWSDSFSMAHFEEFCRKHAELIVARVSEIVGCPLQSVSRSSNNEVEDEED
ncbi:MAG: hypothetical protein OXC96_07915 [Cyanobacteria bacterium MAG CAR1_bin_15]|nr:hypothetical protein [Cyanobacteria bacterium MAG CAR1_bin_15]